ncbi:MAG: permease [Bdellovibrionales bacterium]
MGIEKRDLFSILKIVGGVFLWGGIYFSLENASSFLVSLLPVASDTEVSQSLQFFFYDAPKVFMLLVLVIFVMGLMRSFFSPERTKQILAGHHKGTGHIMAALLGVMTPFCSCSAVPLFIGFLGAGVPIGITFSFLIAAPLVNEIALGLLWALVGWQTALLYLAFGLCIAVGAGFVLGSLNLESWLEGWARDWRGAETCDKGILHMNLDMRIQVGVQSVKEILNRIWLWVLLGIACGAFIHGYVPSDMLAVWLDGGQWWSVPLAVLVGVPLYANHAAILPIASALLGKGVSVGTVLAFMMSVTALSAPEMIILRRVLKKKLIALFILVVAVGILAAGYLFNFLL